MEVAKEINLSHGIRFGLVRDAQVLYLSTIMSARKQRVYAVESVSWSFLNSHLVPDASLQDHVNG
jgi:hypothetical protein